MARTTDHELALAVAVEARALLGQPAHWTTGALARDAQGARVRTDDPAATCWCSLGAMQLAATHATTEERRWYRLLARVNGALEAAVRAQLAPGERAAVMGVWQDAPERTHAEILAVWDAAQGILRAQLAADEQLRKGAP